MSNKKYNKVTITLPVETIALLKEISEKTRLKMSAIIRLGIEKFGKEGKVNE